MLLRYCLFLLLFIPLTATAQQSGLAFLRIGPNAEASAMGDAQVASSQDAFSVYWNPAGLAAPNTNSVAATHRIWVGTLRAYDGFARFQAGKNGGIGLSVTATNSGDLEAREGPGAPDGTFRAGFFSMAAAYGYQLGPLRAGVTAKYITERIFDEKSRGFAVDLGLQATLLQNSLQLGAVVQNIGEMSELAQEATTMPRMVRVGAAVFPLRIVTDDDDALFDLSLIGEVSHLFPDEVTRYHLGASAQLFDILFIRAGLMTNDALRKYSFGLGLHYNAFAFDYALLPFESGFGDPGHLISLIYFW